MDKLPVPNTLKGWMYGFLLILVSFFIYYLWLYPGLERTYYGHYWTAEPYPIADSDLKIDVLTPRYIYSFVEREIKIQVENTDSADRLIDVVVRACQPVNEYTDECNPPDQFMVLMCSSKSDTTIGCNAGGNFVSYGVIPSKGIATRNIWVSIKPVRLDKKYWWPSKWEDMVNNEIKFVYYVRTSIESTFQPVYLRGPSTATVSPGPTLLQSFISIILLPPWANGVLPLLALFVTRLFEKQLI